MNKDTEAILIAVSEGISLYLIDSLIIKRTGVDINIDTAIKVAMDSTVIYLNERFVVPMVEKLFPGIEGGSLVMKAFTNALGQYLLQEVIIGGKPINFTQETLKAIMLRTLILMGSDAFISPFIKEALMGVVNNK